MPQIHISPRKLLYFRTDTLTHSQQQQQLREKAITTRKANGKKMQSNSKRTNDALNFA